MGDSAAKAKQVLWNELKSHTHRLVGSGRQLRALFAHGIEYYVSEFRRVSLCKGERNNEKQAMGLCSENGSQC